MPGPARFPAALSRALAPRLALLLLAVVVARLGRLAEHRLPEPVGGPLGDVLAAALVAVLVLVVRPRTRALTAGLVGFALCAAVELLRLTSLPQALAERWPPLAPVLDAAFSPAGLLWCAAGAVLGAVAGVAVARAVSRGRRAGTERQG
ncbi:DUF2809 domain-containing protein [Isoptericola sp. NPDC058082]|uniref:DUF2809 domain-containing protein n=1 Tax=Isoptericola sp. NPDC058082 TaxID=3346331 RepID=UPI0036E7AD28